jgi:manganese-dependent inorganic pyrophosphatase
LFRREGFTPTPDIAGIMMSGLISDTLHLNGPTTTRKDAIILAWLSEIAGVNSKQLADEIFNSGSVILANPPEKTVRSDYKIYEEESLRFSVSQVEELGFVNFWNHPRRSPPPSATSATKSASPSPRSSSRTSTPKTRSCS